MQATTKRLAPLASIGGGAAALWLVFRHGFVNYDSFYSLVWGNELFHGHSPDYSAALPPTPHPLATLFGVIAAPLGDGAATALVVVAFLTLAAIGYLVYRLGELWLNRWVGLLATAIVLTRVPVLDYGSRAYVDLPYIAFVLGALLVETKRPRAGWPVLALLGLAGLLRPEAWLFSAAYLLYLAYTQSGRPEGRLAPIALLFKPGGLLPLTVLASAAPIAWAAFDLAVTGDALYSLTGTQDTVLTLHRQSGLLDALHYGPRRLGEIVREPVLFAAAGGFAVTLALLRRRVAVGAAATTVAVGAFLVLAAAGLAVITRYLLLPGTLIAIFAAAGALGWLSLDRGNPWRLRWAAFGAVAIVAMLVFAPQQANRLSDLRAKIADQERIRDDLHQTAGPIRAKTNCRPVAVSDYQGVPLLALWLDQRPSAIAAPGPGLNAGVVIFEPTSEETAKLFALDPQAPEVNLPAPLMSALRGPHDRSWVAFGNCKHPAPAH